MQCSDSLDHNGSGKSTTIGCMTGLLDPSGGQIEILGQPFSAENTRIKRRIGVMPETLGLFEPLYAHEFLAFVARMFGIDESTTRRRVTELLEALELTDTSKTLSEYSTGMRKRVAFAAAVIHSPEVLFLDEPFESIDPLGWSMGAHDGHTMMWHDGDSIGASAYIARYLDRQLTVIVLSNQTRLDVEGLERKIARLFL